MELKKLKYKNGDVKSAVFEMSMDEAALLYSVFGNLPGNAFAEQGERWNTAHDGLCDVTDALNVAYEDGWRGTGCPQPSSLSVKF